MNVPQKLDVGKSGRPRGTQSVDDQLNSDIIRMLEADGRMAFSEIAQNLGVSEGTVRNRINGLKEAGMLRIVAIADPSAADYKADAMIGLKVAAGRKPSEVAERLAHLDSVVYILWVTGRYDLIIEMVCDEPEDLSDFLDRHVHSQKDVSDAEVMLGLKNFKNQFLLKRRWHDD
ncbi:MAG: Lrp/AsnC family transcriptional regulator [Pseudomonadota bacterium]